MNGEKTPCMPSLVPVVQLAHPGKLFGRIVDRRGALVPSRINLERFGNLPASASGLMMSKVAPSSPIITVFIQLVGSFCSSAFRRGLSDKLQLVGSFEVPPSGGNYERGQPRRNTERPSMPAGIGTPMQS